MFDLNDPLLSQIDDDIATGLSISSDTIQVDDDDDPVIAPSSTLPISTDAPTLILDP